MKNPSMEETIFDAVLTRAFADAFTEELAELERDCPETVDYPENYRKIERKAYRKRWGGGFRRSRWNRTMQRAAAWILVIGLTGGMLVMMIPEVRAGFRNLVATSFEKYVCFESAATARSHTDLRGGYRFDYIPENYENTVHNFDGRIEYTFESTVDDTYFKISYYPADETSIFFDNENSTISEYDINGNNGYLMYFYKSDDYSLTWIDGNNLFTIDATIPSDEILKIARNIFKIE